ncbi:DivIVA domain-containing protein [Merdibacter massiliensis]|uniref:DivIVA domain-containing protein n=1 Tax=Merdibacter massiliensis TaxID=1871030 RepID=UPI00096A81B3|nr:DivIVA domain-containing protein [Merdibacter massiliensis]
MAQKFDRMKDGYNRYQVDLAMEELDMRIDNLQRINEAYQLRCKQLEEQIRYLESVYSPAFQNLRQKEDAASQMVAIAMKEANTIVSTAKQNADVIIGEALLNAREMLADITHLAQETQDAKGTMKRQTQRIADLLDEFEEIAFPEVELLNEKKR